MSARGNEAVKKVFMLFTTLFSITTIISSMYQLWQGHTSDTNFHILNRAVVTLIASVIITLFERISIKDKLISYIIPYVISMALIFSYVWLTGFVEPLHPNAYRDIFLNFTAVAVCVATISWIRDRRKKRHVSIN